MSIAKTTRPHLLTREAAAARIEALEEALWNDDDDIKELLFRCFVKLNGGLPPIDTQISELCALFDEVIAEHRAATPPPEQDK